MEAIYVCSYFECYREFTNKRSFQKHKSDHLRHDFLSKHAPQNNSIPSLEISHQENKENLETSYEEPLSEPLLETKSFSNISNDLKYAIYLYNEPTFSRKSSLDVINNTNQLVSSDLERVLRELKDNPENLESFLNERINLLQKKQTEHTIFKDLKKEGVLIESHSVVISRQHLPSKQSVSEEIFEIELIPLRTIFSALFNNTNMLNIIDEYIKSIQHQNEFISNVTQSKWWKEIKSQVATNNDGKTLVIPALVYFDDFEPNNALGSHSSIHKTGAVYVQIPCLPSHLQAKLAHIYLAQLFFSSDRTNFGNSRIFKPLIEELNFLSDVGITISNNDSYNLVKIIPIALIGDNLGLNSMMGFVECFSAHFYCRICKSKKCDMHYQYKPCSNTIRTIANYEEDVRMDNVSETGIKEESIFNTLSYFHVVNNHSVDFMHDVQEGVCHYVLLFLIKKFANTYNFFTISDLNKRIQLFNYGYQQNINKIVPISEDILKKSKLKLSASETTMFFKSFGILVGDLIPNDNKEWKLYIKLRELVSLLMQSPVHNTAHQLLQVLVEEFNQLYTELTETHLKPKFHFLVHYAKVMELMGPIKQFWSMRFESKHSELKKTAHSTQSRRNLIKTMALKHQLRFAHILSHFNDLLINKTECGNLISLDEIQLSHMQEKFNFSKNSSKMYETKWIERNSISYKKGVVIIVNCYDDDTPIFGEIKNIILIDKKYYFCYQKLSTIGFDEHFYAYEVSHEEQYNCFALDDLKDFSDLYINTTVNNKKVINSILY